MMSVRIMSHLKTGPFAGRVEWWREASSATHYTEYEPARYFDRMSWSKPTAMGSDGIPVAEGGNASPSKCAGRVAW
jgi:hypothetical protein